MKLYQVVLIGLALAIGSATVAMGATDWRLGKKVFKKQCKVCHFKGAEGGKVTEDSKTRSQWRRFFKKNYHSEVLQDISENEIKSLRLFLDRSAADAAKAETCG